MMVGVFENSVYTVPTEGGKVQVHTFQGTVKQLLPCSEMEGDPICMAVCTRFLVMATAHGYIKLYDLAKR